VSSVFRNEYDMCDPDPTVINISGLPRGRLCLLFACLAVCSTAVVAPAEERAILQKHRSFVWSLALAPDGKTLASSGGTNEIVIWDTRTWKDVTTLRDTRLGVVCIAFSPDGKYLAATGFQEPARVYDTSTWKIRQKLMGIDHSTRCVTFSPDSNTLATSGFSNLVALWDVATGQPRKSFSVGVEHLRPLAFSPEGKTLAAGGGSGKVVLWDLAQNKLRARLEGHKAGVQTVAFSADGKLLATLDAGIGMAERRAVADPVFDPATHKVVKVKIRHVLREDNRRVFLWDPATGKLKGRVDLEDSMNPARACAFSPDSKMLAVVGEGDVFLWSVADQRRWGRIKCQPCESVAFSPDGKLLFAGGSNGSVFVWDVPEKEPVKEKKVPNRSKDGPEAKRDSGINATEAALAAEVLVTGYRSAARRDALFSTGCRDRGSEGCVCVVVRNGIYFGVGG
jgi:WD40 repeat protein